MNPLHQIRFRSSPCVELKPLGDLGPEQREAFRELESDPELYGLLVAKPPRTMNVKSVTRQTAELFQSLTTPSHLQDAILGDEESIADVVDLVLDGILEIESLDGFVSGADAWSVLSFPAAGPDAYDRAAGLSRDALLYAQDLATRDPRALTNALYFYNRIPITPFWRTRFASRDAILAHLGADRGTLRALLEREWSASWQGVSSMQKSWLNWSPKTSPLPNENGVTYKLYVSPRPERIRDAFEVAVRVLSTFEGTPFKLGGSAAGLLRPDKLIAYFTTRERLGEVAEVLRCELEGCEAHGVPFTASLDENALLSWGIDPPDSDRALRWLERDSWRFWVVKRLGAALSVAKAACSTNAVEPWRFAVERVRRHGVDVATWIPSPALWSTS